MKALFAHFIRGKKNWEDYIDSFERLAIRIKNLTTNFLSNALSVVLRRKLEPK